MEGVSDIDYYKKRMKKTSQKLTVTVGIPAYNEGRNIPRILEALLEQKGDGFILESVVVVSDGSTDDTTARARSVNDPRIKVIQEAERFGKPLRVNQIFEQSTSDVVVLLDADIEISSNDLLAELVRPFFASTPVSVVFGSAEPLPPKNMTQGVLKTGWNIWHDLRYAVPYAEMYQCEGTVRAFRKGLYQVMRFPNLSSENVFPFLYCKKYGHGISFAPDARVFYALPATYRDYVRQTVRFLGSEKNQCQNFEKDFVRRFYVIQNGHKVKALGFSLFKKPLLTSLYLLFWIIPKIISLFKIKETKTSLWKIAYSTKDNSSGFIGEKRKKIIFSNYDDIKNLTYGGGGAFAVHEVAKYLTANFQVEVLTGRYPQATDDRIDGVLYRRIGTSLFGARVGQIFFHLVLPFHVLFRKYDLWIESFTPPFSTSFTPLFTNKPVIGLVHMLSAKDMSRKYFLPFTVIENLGLKYYRHFIALTEESALQIKEHNPFADIQIIGNGTDVPAVPNESGGMQGKHLSFIGRVEVDQKGLDLLLKAYTEIQKDVDIPLVIAGTGSSCEIARLKKLIHAHRLADKVKLLGRISGVQKEEFYRKTLIGLVPSRYETSPLVVLEMMSYGISVVGFSIPGLVWASRNATVQVPSFDTHLFAQAVISLAHDKARYKSISANARIMAEGRSWGIVSEKYKQYIEFVLESPSSRFAQRFPSMSHH